MTAAVPAQEAWQTAEILLMRHQLATLQWQQARRPNLDWADRALLATLLGVIPKARGQGLRLLATLDTLAPRPLPPLDRQPMRAKAGQPTRQNNKALVLRFARENPNRDTAGSMANWPA